MINKKEQYKNKIIKGVKNQFNYTIFMIFVMNAMAIFMPIVFNRTLIVTPVNSDFIHYQQISFLLVFNLFFGSLFVSSFYKVKKRTRQILKYIENKTFEELEQVYMDEHEI